MKANYSQMADFIEDRYAEEYFEASEEELVARYEEDLAQFYSWSHVKSLNDTIRKQIDKAAGEMFKEGKLGLVTVSDGSYLFDANGVNIQPNFVMHEGKPFIIGPYITHTFELSHMISIATDNKSEPTMLQLSFKVNAVGEEQDGYFCVTTNTYRNGLEIEYYNMARYIKDEIMTHMEERNIKPYIGADVRAFNKILLTI